MHQSTASWGEATSWMPVGCGGCGVWWLSALPFPATSSGPHVGNPGQASTRLCVARIGTDSIQGSALLYCHKQIADNPLEVGRI